MTRETLKTASGLALPKGNEWRFNEDNLDLRPSTSLHEHVDLFKVNELVRSLIHEVTGLLRREWSFASILENPERVVLIYTNPYKKEAPLANMREALDGIMERDGKGVYESLSCVFNEALVPTNLSTASNSVSFDFNSVRVMERSGKVLKKEQQKILYQSGVAYVEALLRSYTSRINSLEEDIASLETDKKQRLEVVEKCDNAIAKAVGERDLYKQLLTPNPQPLFKG